MSDAGTSRRSVGRPFPPGKSGNPSGRPKAVHDFQKLAREATPAAFQRLVELSNSRNQLVAVRACELIVSWGVGRPQQSVALAASGPLPESFVGAARAVLEQAIAAAEAKDVPALPAADGGSSQAPIIDVETEESR